MKYIVVLCEPVYSSIQGHLSDVDTHVLAILENNREAERWRATAIKENNYEPLNIHVVQVLA